MTNPRLAACSCGALRAKCSGDPVRVSVCHCLACQQRTGSAFGAQARFPRARVELSGPFTRYTRTADSGNRIHFSFCPTCGSTVCYELEAQPDIVAVPLGAFADPSFPEPAFSVYEARRHRWVKLETEGQLEHHD